MTKLYNGKIEMAAACVIALSASHNTQLLGDNITTTTAATDFSQNLTSS